MLRLMVNAGDKALHDHLITVSSKATYIRKTIQNELTHLHVFPIAEMVSFASFVHYLFPKLSVQLTKDFMYSSL